MKPPAWFIVPPADFTENELLRLAAGLERGSEHPLAAAIVAAAAERGLPLAEARDFAAPPGLGVSGTVDGRMIAIGSRRFLDEHGMLDDPRPPAERAAEAAGVDRRAEALRQEGMSAVLVAIGGAAGAKPDRVAGIIGIADPLKPTTADAIAALRAAGLRIVMLTGDDRTTAEAVGRRLGIDEIEAGVLPEGKTRVIERLRREGRGVAMAGDGVNDAPALAAADVGLAMGTGTDVAIETAGVTLLKGDLQGIVRARRLSAATMRNIRQNLFFAFLYNVVGVPIAAGVLYPFFGLLLSPAIAAAAMSLSSVSVIANALRLRGLRL